MNLNKILKFTALGGIFCVPFIPLIVTNDLFFPFITGKNFAFRIIIEIAFSAWIILALRNKEFRPKISFLLWAFVVFVGIIAFADLLSPNPEKSFLSNYERMEGWITLIHLFAYFIVSSVMLRTERIWSWFFHTNFGVSLFMILYSILQLSGELVINQGGVRVDGTFGNAIYFAIYLLFNSFLLLYFVLSNRSRVEEILWSYIGGFSGFLLFYLGQLGGNGGNIHAVGVILFLFSLFSILGTSFLLWKNAVSRKKTTFLSVHGKNILYGLLIFAEFTILFYTATRGAILGSLIGVIFILTLFSLFEKENKNIRRVSVGFLTALILLGAVFFSVKDTQFVKSNSILSRFSSLLNSDLKTFLEKGEGKSRYLNGKAAIAGFKERPILGWGQESFNYVFNTYYDPKMYDQEPWFDRAHNVILDWLIAGGIVGLLSYLSLFGFAFCYLWKGARGKEQILTFKERTVLAGLLVAYFLQNFTVFDNITSYILFFTVLAYIHSGYGKSLPIEKSKSVKEQNLALGKIAVPLVGIALVFSIYFLNVKPILAAYSLSRAISYSTSDPLLNLEYFKKALSYSSFGQSEIREFVAQFAEKVSASNLDQAVKDAYFDLAKKELMEQLKETPGDLRYYYFAGVMLNKSKNYSEGIPYLEKAVKISPKKQAILAELGSAYINIGDFEKGLAIFKQAYEAEPSIENMKILYALGAVYAGNEPLAKQILGKDYESVIEKDVRFVNAYIARQDYAKAIQMLKKRIEKEPNNTQNHLFLADIYLRLNDRIGAIGELQNIIKIDPQFKERGEEFIKQIQEGKI